MNRFPPPSVGAAVSRLHRLYREQGQSPWLDNLTRPYLRDGTSPGSWPPGSGG